MANQGTDGKPRVITVVALMILAAAGVAGIAAYVTLGPGAEVPEGERRIRKTKVKEQPGIQIVEHGTHEIPMPTFQDGELRFESKPITVPAGVDEHVFVVNEFLKQAGAESDTLVTSIDLDGGVANVRFTEGLEAGMGSMEETTLVMGIRASLGQFPGIQGLRFYIGERLIGELGHVELSNPTTVIRPDDWLHPSTPRAEPPPSQ